MATGDTATQGYEVGYDEAGNVQIIEGVSRVEGEVPDQVRDATALEGGCTAGGGTMEAAARLAGKSEILDR